MMPCMHVGGGGRFMQIEFLLVGMGCAYHSSIKA